MGHVESLVAAFSCVFSVVVWCWQVWYSYDHHGSGTLARLLHWSFPFCYFCFVLLIVWFFRHFQPLPRLVQLPQNFLMYLHDDSQWYWPWPICTARGEVQWAISEGVPTWFHFHFSSFHTHYIMLFLVASLKIINKLPKKENKCMSEWKPQKPTKLNGNDTTTSIESLGTRLHTIPTVSHWELCTHLLLPRHMSSEMILIWAKHMLE